VEVEEMEIKVGERRKNAREYCRPLNTGTRIDVAKNYSLPNQISGLSNTLAVGA
jgi:hypothetical protein